MLSLRHTHLLANALPVKLIEGNEEFFYLIWRDYCMDDVLLAWANKLLLSFSTALK